MCHTIGIVLRQKYRFHGHGSLRYLYKNGTAVRSRLFTFKFVANPRRPHPRYGVVVSKKTLKSAVGRNRIRRRVYEVLREQLPLIDPTYDMVIIVASSEVAIMPAPELREALLEMFSRADLYKKPPQSDIV